MKVQTRAYCSEHAKLMGPRRLATGNQDGKSADNAGAVVQAKSLIGTGASNVVSSPPADLHMCKATLNTSRQRQL